MRFNLVFIFSVFVFNFCSGQGTAETKVSAYIGIVHPIYTAQGGKVTPNFRDFYQVGMTTAVIIRKAKNYAYNLEVVGFVRNENGVTKMNNFLLHPGVTIYLKKNFSITPRMGFENSGRFGPSLIIGKTMFKAAGHPVNFNLVNLLRFGKVSETNKGASFTNAINLTFGF